MNKFKTGDKVRVYYWDGQFDTVVSSTYYDFVIVHFDASHRTEQPQYEQYHYKQCRKLVPRKPKRKLFTTEQQLTLAKDDLMFAYQEPNGKGQWVEFKEIKKRK